MSKKSRVLRLHVKDQNPEFPSIDQSVIYIDRPFVQGRLGKSFALTPECTLPEMDWWIDKMIGDLEEARRQAHRKMGKTTA